MATNFPTSIDALTNPSSGDTLASPDHAGQHANANDAIEALQAKVGVNSSAVATSLDYLVAQKANLASPTLTGTPLAPTAAVDTNTTQVATTAYVVGQGYAKLASPTFTGTPTLPTGTIGTTQTAADSSTKLATTAFVTTADDLKANLASPTFTGTVTGSPAAGTITTGTSGFGYMGLPQNSTTTGSYIPLASDAGKHIYSTATRTITIQGNANGGTPWVAFPVGTTIVFVAGSGATVTIQMETTTTDICLLAGAGTSMTGGSGSRTLAPFGMATLLKITSTSWMISGNGLT